MTPQFHLFLPQMRLSVDALVERARAAEAAGFTGMCGMDHLAPPLALDQPMYEAMTCNAFLAARTEHLRLGSLVLCDAFRHPTQLAREAVTLDHVSTGRFELGIGSGSVPSELATFGIGFDDVGERVTRLGESLDVLAACWSGEVFDYDGRFVQVRGGQQLPTPLTRIPIVIGGTGPRMMKLVAKHADWWNVPIHQLDRLDDMRARAGDARVSVQERVVFVANEGQRAEIVATAARRFGTMGIVTGNGDELVEHYTTRVAQGVERFYVWFADFGPPSTLAAFGEQVIGALR
jgi:alkanesulfonate monooxygenase SsuD/methylene tetrahydromethanopterin reductase-like flavin-dependent oxidoreductase (luciferase family)